MKDSHSAGGKQCLMTYGRAFYKAIANKRWQAVRAARQASPPPTTVKLATTPHSDPDVPQQGPRDSDVN